MHRRCHVVIHRGELRGSVGVQQLCELVLPSVAVLRERLLERLAVDADETNVLSAVQMRLG